MTIVLHVEDLAAELQAMSAHAPGDVVVDLEVIVADTDDTAAASVVERSAAAHDRIGRKNELWQRLVHAVYIEAQFGQTTNDRLATERQARLIQEVRRYNFR